MHGAVENQSEPDSEAAARGEGRACRAGCYIPASGRVAEPGRAQARGKGADTAQQHSGHREGTCVSCALHVTSYLMLSTIVATVI